MAPPRDKEQLLPDVQAPPELSGTWCVQSPEASLRLAFFLFFFCLTLKLQGETAVSSDSLESPVGSPAKTSPLWNSETLSVSSLHCKPLFFTHDKCKSLALSTPAHLQFPFRALIARTEASSWRKEGSGPGGGEGPTPGHQDHPPALSVTDSRLLQPLSPGSWPCLLPSVCALQQWAEVSLPFHSQTPLQARGRLGW